eukprot:3574988-Prymnesium_polylepis.1
MSLGCLVWQWARDCSPGEPRVGPRRLQLGWAGPGGGPWSRRDRLVRRGRILGDVVTVCVRPHLLGEYRDVVEIVSRTATQISWPGSSTHSAVSGCESPDTGVRGMMGAGRAWAGRQPTFGARGDS